MTLYVAENQGYILCHKITIRSFFFFFLSISRLGCIPICRNALVYLAVYMTDISTALENSAQAEACTKLRLDQISSGLLGNHLFHVPIPHSKNIQPH